MCLYDLRMCVFSVRMCLCNFCMFCLKYALNVFVLEMVCVWFVYDLCVCVV